jgi:hypothetical protein
VTKSHVLKALRILGLEEILKLSKAAFVKPVFMKRAAGEDLIVWSDAPENIDKLDGPSGNNGTLLPFKKKQPAPSSFPEPVSNNDKAPTNLAETPCNIQSSEFILWNREKTKTASSPVLKKEAAKEYAKSTEMYVVKTSTIEGKDKIRFADTNGVLVNKKQA